MAGIQKLPLILPIAGFGALTMLIPAAYASAINEHKIAQNFLYSSLLFLIVFGLIGLASASNRYQPQARGSLLTMLAVMAVMPLMLAVPFAESVPDTGLFNAWWEMVSSLTTTGASLYSADLLPTPLHLWRAMVGWMGGLFMLIAAVSILAPLRVGGFEITSPHYAQDEQLPKLRQGAGAPAVMPHLSGPAFQTEITDPTHRMTRAARAVFPVYAGLTLALWVILLLLGDTALVALCRAMGTLATSGISPVIGQAGENSGLWGEMAVFLFLIPALSRRFWPGGGQVRASDRRREDPELRLAAGVVVLVAAVLFARHFIGAIEVSEVLDAKTGVTTMQGLGDALSAAWGGLFNAMSYLTTTGWNSLDWQEVRAWSGLTSPGIILAGLAMFGGGVATTAGGVKLLRVYALARHSERELERIVHPSSVSGGGRMARRLRRQGAYLAFIFFMLFAMSIAVVVMLISIQQVEFETATILSIAALTNTGPLAAAIPLTPAFEGTAGVASAPWEGWSGLSVLNKSILAGAMIVGRLEILAILALFTPEYWRR